MNTLFISDLDGTLLNENKVISQNSVDMINKAIANGAKFTIATARSASTAIDMAKDIKINAPAVLMNGVFVYDIATGKYLKYESIEKPISHHIIEIINRYTTKGRMFSFNGNGVDVYCTDKEVYEDNVSEEYLPHKAVYLVKNFEDAVDIKPVVSFVVVDSFEKLKPIYKDLKENEDISPCFYEDVYVPGLYWLEIHSVNATKAKAMAFVKAYTKTENAVAFGDNINDIDMLKSADIGCAVSNAVCFAKDAANIVLDKSNSEDAVALYILEKTLGE